MPERDIVERLRATGGELNAEAADSIERLRASVRSWLDEPTPAAEVNQ